MSGPDDECDYAVAIVGGGAAGVLTAIQLLRRAERALRIVLVSATLPLADGVAYSTRRPEHLLNVPAGRMSALPDQPDDFVAFLRTQVAFAELPAAALAQRYVARLHYADYLRQRLRQAVQHSCAKLETIHDRVLELDKHDHALQLRLASGATLRAGKVVLALGNASRPLPVRGVAGLDARHLLEAWDDQALADIAADATVCIVGSGLSMVDAAMTLHARGHRGPIHVLSRHGLMPLPHAHGDDVALDLPALLALPLRQRVRRLRSQARTCGQRWQGLMEALRPHGQALWRSLSEREQRRFLRHLARYWDVHRHRIAPGVRARLQTLRDSGQLQLHRGRLDTVIPIAACVQLNAHTASGATLQLDAHRIINATGLEMRLQAMRNPLLQQLLGCGHALAGAHGIGVATDDAGHLIDADGRADPRIQVLGTLRIGQLWESLAIPELREQASAAATALSALDDTAPAAP